MNLLKKKKLIIGALVLALVFAIALELTVFVYDTVLDVSDASDSKASLLDPSVCTRGIIGYGVSENGTYTPNTADPQMVFIDIKQEVRSVLITFKNKLSASVICQVFFARNSDFNETDSLKNEISLGKNFFIFDLPKGNYDDLRLDIDGAFTIEDIVVTNGSFTPRKMAVQPLSVLRILVTFVLTSLILLLLIWWKYSKKERKSAVDDLFFSILICVPCAVLCVLLCQNEIYMDDWYIEASADGFFGADNRSVWVLGSNIILTGLIYLLSLTGIRLFWLHIILLAVNFVSHVLITLVLVRNKGKYYGAVASVFFGLLMGPLAYFEYQFTTTAALGIAAGCVFMMDAIKHERKGDVLFSAVWIVFLSGIRLDGIYFSIAYMGTFWLFQNIPDIFMDKTRFLEKKQVWNLLKKRLLPFLITLAVCFGIDFSYRIAMDIAVPGFREFNAVRTKVDDCEMPDYETYREEFESINLSLNDYNLMLAWNNMDPEFFTQEKLEQILEIAEVAEAKESSDGLLRSIWNSASKNAAIWILMLGTIFCIAITKKRMLWCCLSLIGVTLVFYAYFLNIGRLIWRTEWPIWIVLSCTLVLVICEVDAPQIMDAKGRIKALLLASIVLFCPFFNANSLYGKYKERAQSWTSVYRYLNERIVRNNSLCYETYCRYSAAEIIKDKENYYFALGSPEYWLQQYPMPAVDTLRFNEVGDGENWGTLGQYFALLPQVTRAYNKYGIDNPFRDLVNENVRVTGRAAESYHRIKTVHIYLEEHYYEDVSFSLEKILHNNEVVVGRFIHDIPAAEMTELNGIMNASFGGNTIINRMIGIQLDLERMPVYDPQKDDAYVCMRNEQGENHIFSVYDLDPSKVITFDDSLRFGERYTLDFVFEHDGVWYVAKDCGVLQMPAVM